jgi:sigma-B regulation protein RsbU (phosphoserine phosphatase)
MDKVFQVVSGLEKSIYKLAENSEVLVGRSEEESVWVIHDPDISRKHMRLFFRNKAVWVEDLNSTNGVYVNRQKIVAPCMIEEKDILLIGQTSISFVINNEDKNQPKIGSKFSSSKKPGVKDIQTSLMIPGLDGNDLSKMLGHSELHKKLDVLYKISCAGNHCEDLIEYYEFVFKLLSEHLEYRRIVALYLNEDSYEIIHYRSIDNSTLDISQLSQTIVDVCVENQQVMFSNFAQGDERFSGSESLRRQIPLAILCAPLIVSGKVLGAIVLDVENYKKLFTLEDMMLFSACAANLAWALHHNLLLKQLVEKERKDSDLRIAKDIQQNCLLSSDKLPKIEGIDIASLYQPYEIVGGDYYDIINDGKTAIFVSADVSGKGVSAALVVSMIRAYVKTIVHSNKDPLEIMSQLHFLFENDLPKKMFVTASVAAIDLATKKLSICRAGHTYLIHYSKRKNIGKLIGGKGIMIGVAATEIFKARIEKSVIDLEIGDVIMMYTDGLSEARNARNELYGDERLAECVAHFAYKKSQEILQEVQNSILSFGGPEGIMDDMCAIVVKVMK